METIKEINNKDEHTCKDIYYVETLMWFLELINKMKTKVRETPNIRKYTVLEFINELKSEIEG